MLSRSTKEAVDAFVKAHAEAGVLGVFPYENRLFEYRERVGKFIGAIGDEIVFLRNTTHGATTLAGAFDWNAGDEMLLCDDEFPANAIPWLALRERGVNVRRIAIRESRERLTPDRLRQEMTPRTRLVTVSWVNFADGYRHDLTALAEIAHSHGAILVVDAIQGLGAFPLDVRATNVDAIFSGGAKWLLSLHGSAFLYVRRELLERMRVATPGWRSLANKWDFFNYDQPWLDDASRFEDGVPNFLGVLSLVTSIELLERSNPHAIAAHILHLTDHLYDGLQRIGAVMTTERGPSCSSGIVTFNPPGKDPIALGRALQHDEKMVTTWRANGIRVSPHGYNTLEEIDMFLQAMRQHIA